MCVHLHISLQSQHLDDRRLVHRRLADTLSPRVIQVLTLSLPDGRTSCYSFTLHSTRYDNFGKRHLVLLNSIQSIQSTTSNYFKFMLLLSEIFINPENSNSPFQKSVSSSMIRLKHPVSPSYSIQTSAIHTVNPYLNDMALYFSTFSLEYLFVRGDFQINCFLLPERRSNKGFFVKSFLPLLIILISINITTNRYQLFKYNCNFISTVI